MIAHPSQAAEKRPASLVLVMLLCTSMLSAQAQQDTPNAPAPQTATASTSPTVAPSTFSIRTPPSLAMPHSRNPLNAYTPSSVPKPNLANSKRLEDLVRDGKLYISLQEAIALALENNLDLAIARYNLPIADTDILRTKAGGSFRGVNTGIVQGTPGGGVGGFGSGAREPVPAVRRVAQVARARAPLDSFSRRSV